MSGNVPVARETLGARSAPRRAVALPRSPVEHVDTRLTCAFFAEQARYDAEATVATCAARRLA